MSRLSLMFPASPLGLLFIVLFALVAICAVQTEAQGQLGIFSESPFVFDGKLMGPRGGCPACQPKRGRPKITRARRSTKELTLDTGVADLRVLTVANPIRFEISSKANVKKEKYALELDSIFQAKTQTGFKESEVDNSTIVAFTGKPEPYTWEISTASDASDDETSMVSFKVTAIPASASTDSIRPNIEFSMRVLANENQTTAKFDVSITNFKNTWWKNNTQTLVLAFRVPTEAVEDGRIKQVYGGISDVIKGRNLTMPKPPVAGQKVAGTEIVSGQFISASGLQFLSSNTAVAGDGTDVPVTISVGAGCCRPGDEKYRTIYIAYDRFVNSIRHDPYYSLNDASLSSSSVVKPMTFAIGLLTVMLSIIMFAKFD